MDTLPLFTTAKERFYFVLVYSFIFIFNIYSYFQDYKSFIDEEVYRSKATILNIYDKPTYKVLKLKTDKFICFTSIPKKLDPKIWQEIDLYLVTKNISFYEYLKGFYTKNFNLVLLNETNSIKKTIYSNIESQHQNRDIASLYNALFLATNISSDLRDVVSLYGVSHLVAISGFHLGVISFIVYLILNIFYKPLHQRYMPYRNKRYDIFVVTSILLLFYLIFLDNVPSLLRAFSMFILAFIFLRSNIKVVSFETLFIVTIIIISIFPKLLFSISLWLSVIGVFYIFLFIKYFSNLNKYLKIFIFNFWIFFAINPIVHFIFDTTSLEQLLSPLITLLFTLFYPIAFISHLVGYGDLFDPFLIDILNMPYHIYHFATPIYFLVPYILISIFSIYNKRIFYLLNILLILFNFFLYLPISI